MQVTNTDPLYTRVRNNTGKTRVFGFLGDQGMRLSPNEVVTVRGDLRSTLAGHKRKFDGLSRALLAGDLVIEETPPPVLFDEVNETPHLLALRSGELGIVDPTWDESGSSIFVDGST